MRKKENIGGAIESTVLARQQAMVGAAMTVGAANQAKLVPLARCIMIMIRKNYHSLTDVVMRTDFGILVGILLFLFGCATQPPILYGDHRYSALSADTTVAVYMKESDIHEQYEVVGAFGAIDLGKWQVLRMEDALPTLKEKARSIGANAIIIDEYQPVKSGIISTGYSVRARGIRLSGS